MERLAFLIGFLLLVVNCRKPPIFSIDGFGDEKTISSELRDSLGTQKGVDFIFQIGYPYVSLIEANGTIEGDIKYPIALGLPINNGDIDSDHFEVLYGIKNDQTISHKNITLILNKPNSIIQSHPKVKTVLNDSYDRINCSYSISDIEHKLTNLEHDELANILKIERMNRITFAQVSNRIKVLEYNHMDSVVEIKDIEKYETKPFSLNSITVTTFWLSIQRGKDAYLLVYDNTQIYLYLITISENRMKIYKKETVNFSGCDLKKVVKFDDYLYFSGPNKLSIERHKISSPPSAAFREILFHLASEIKDYVVEQGSDSSSPSIYSITKNEGLYFYENSINKQIYIHKSMEQIDYFVNPFYGNKFLGIRTTQTRDDEEFFIEIIISNSPTSFKINKILTSKMKTFLPFYTLDLFHSFFYDKDSKQMYIIRRGLVNIVNFLTYQIDLSTYDTPDYLSSITQTNGADSLLLFSKGQKSYSINQLDYPKHNVSCSFKEEGSYNIRLLQYSEACNTSLTATQSIPNSCQKLVEFNLEIYDKTSRSLIKQAGGWLITLFTLGFIAILVALFFSSNCLQENIFALIQDDRFTLKGLCYDDTLANYPSINLEKDNANTNDSSTMSKMSSTFSKESPIMASQTKTKKRITDKKYEECSSEARLSNYQNSFRKKSSMNNSEGDIANIIQVRKK